MIWKRQLAIFGIAFALVLVGGIALAAVGTLAPQGADLAASEEHYEEPYGEPEPTTTTMAEEHEEDGIHEEEGSGEGEHGEEPKEEPNEEPKEEPAEEPKEEPAEPKEEPAEPKEEIDSTPPDFGITAPENGSHTDDEVITFKGFVEPGSTVTRGKWTADQEGEHWAMTLVLSPGKNVVGFLATDAAGNVSDASVTVYYEAPEKEEPKEEPGEVEWSAKQKYGSCGENPPYDIFYGTATPGTKIWVESKYGGGSVTANGDGQWSIKVNFYEVPAGTSFEVVVESSNGNSKVFPFTYTGGGEEH